MATNMQVWTGTINDEPLPEVSVALIDPEAFFTIRDSAKELKAGCQVDFVDTIPNEFMEYFK